MNETITPIGELDYRDDHRVFGLKRKDRRYHLLTIGRTGTGKSTLMANLIKADLKNGEGIALFDPHGDLAEAVEGNFPAWRTDGLFFSPGTEGNTLTFNPLHVPRPEQRHLVVSELITVFQQIWDKAWGPRLEYILKIVLLSLTEKPGYTLLDALRMLNDAEFRTSVVDQLEDPILIDLLQRSEGEVRFLDLDPFVDRILVKEHADTPDRRRIPTI